MSHVVRTVKLSSREVVYTEVTKIPGGMVVHLMKLDWIVPPICSTLPAASRFVRTVKLECQRNDVHRSDEGYSRTFTVTCNFHEKGGVRGAGRGGAGTFH